MNRRFSRHELPAMRSVAPSIVNALIRRSTELRRLYQCAAAASEPGSRVVLNDNAHILDLLIADLQMQVGAHAAGPVARGDWRGIGYRHAADWLLRAVTRREGDWFRVLADRESTLLRAFERAIAMAPAELDAVLRRQLPRLYGMHLDMDTLAGNARH